MGSVASLLFGFKKNEALYKQFDVKAWETVEAGDDEKVVEDLTAKLEQRAPILKQLEFYDPRSELIRKALSEPTFDNDREAFEAVIVNAEVIYGFFKYGVYLGETVPTLVKKIGAVCEDDQVLFIQDAASKRLVEILDFVLRFDELKMLRPGLQNDFSFYRRSLGKHVQDFDLLVKDEDTSLISLFLAAHIPMMTALAKKSSVAYQDDENVTTAIAEFANACLSILKFKVFAADHKANGLFLRAMVGAVVLFDHVEPEGAFHKRSPIMMKYVCKMLVGEFQRDYPGVLADPVIENLINTLRFSTMHFKDDSTPSSIAAALE
uniref:CYRIA/CYRIB Rac1 binding domain-containing protein n=1 Tax=Hirondellea gigas TaxID=1518452 RepID=A0A6A7FPV7_9CRUS